MKKTITLMLAAVMLLAAFAGCARQENVDVSHLEREIARLDEELAALRGSVEALQTENTLLRLQLEELDMPELEQPHEESDYNPIAELNIYDWSVEDGSLTIRGFARVMALAKGDGTIGQVENCTLELRRNEVGWETRALQLLPGEASDSLELELEGEAFSLETLEDGDSLELRLELILTDGTVLTAVGGGWDYADGQLMMIAG